ncbi:glycosyltransferase family 4 protein [Hoeflea sp. WL0058]|uniref:Glycosyltransferase family 4 protein n=1 Tax=Flavimaribacter sediminis TaxID=2865987 RepID=A0AAE2ZR58_9HYPH|nr:glycosyltransferase family 4 protein [Flavimaribacter sediminis]MBW8638923.1 glycosyltransferase family 4 protein [Flavimaribacter sediminis]
MINAITHIVDDDSFGGVNRMLAHMTNSPVLYKAGQHRIVRVRRGQFTPPKIKADIIVSHLSVNWANMPMLTAIRAIHPRTAFIHVEHSYSERFVTANVENRWRFETLLETAYSLFDTVVAVSRPQFDWMLRRQLCNPKRLRYVPSGVDLAPFFALDAPAEDRPFVLGAFGRLNVQKGFDILVKGFNLSGRQDMELHFFGDGEERAALETLAAGKPNIVFHGYVENTAEAMARCHAVAMPSRWEPFGLVALETMAAGRPLLCPRVDGLRQHISNGAIDIGDNTVAGWSAFLQELDLAAMRDGEKNRSVAASTTDNFLEGWLDLCNAGDREETIALAA